MAIFSPETMDRPQHSDLVTALKELSWSDVKRMAIHLDKSVDLALLEDIEQEYPIKERLMYTMKAWLERDCDASWDKVFSALQMIGQNVLVKKIKSTAADPIIAQLPMNSPDHRPEGDLPVTSLPIKLQPSPGLAFLQQENEASASLVPVLDHSCTDSHDIDVSGNDRNKTQSRKEYHIHSITVPMPVTLHGQTESDPPVVSPVELQPSPGLDSLHQLQPENEATVTRTPQEPAFDHSASVSQDTTERETSDCPAVTQPERNSISGWRSERRQISNDGILAAIIGVAVVAAAGQRDYGILTSTAVLVAMVAFGVKLCIVFGVPTGLRKLSVFAAVAAVVVAVLVGAGTARNTTPTSAGTARTTGTASRETVATASSDRSVILLAVQEIITALGAVAFGVLAAEEVLPVLVAVAAAVTIVVGAGVMAAAAVISGTAAIMAVAAAGAARARGPSQAAAAVVALAIAVVTAAVGAPIYNTCTVAAAVVAIVATVAVRSSPAIRLAAAVTVGTVVVAEAAAVMTALAAVVVGPPVAAVAAVAAVIIIAAVALELASKLHSYLY